AWLKWSIWSRGSWGNGRSGPAERRSEVLAEADFALDGGLVRRDLALEEVRELLHVLQLHEPEGVAGAVDRRDAQRDQPAVGDGLQVLPHVAEAHAGHAFAEHVGGELVLGLDGLPDHLGDLGSEDV